MFFHNHFPGGLWVIDQAILPFPQNCLTLKCNYASSSLQVPIRTLSANLLYFDTGWTACRLIILLIYANPIHFLHLEVEFLICSILSVRKRLITIIYTVVWNKWEKVPLPLKKNKSIGLGYIDHQADDFCQFFTL